MAASTYARGLAVSDSEFSNLPRHSVAVRVTHWLTALSFIALVLSGLAILLAQPRLYWGETGVRGGPSLIDLPLPFVLDVPIRGPGRYVHFLAAWISVFTGLIYVATGLLTHHFSKHLLLTRSDLNWKRLCRVDHFGRCRFQFFDSGCEKENAASVSGSDWKPRPQHSVASVASASNSLSTKLW